MKTHPREKDETGSLKFSSRTFGYGYRIIDPDEQRAAKSFARWKI
ncbi:hypothetical protein ABNF65_04240 [Paenibacillus larvae]